MRLFNKLKTTQVWWWDFWLLSTSWCQADVTHFRFKESFIKERGGFAFLGKPSSWFKTDAFFILSLPMDLSCSHSKQHACAATLLALSLTTTTAPAMVTFLAPLFLVCFKNALFPSQSALSIPIAWQASFALILVIIVPMKRSVKLNVETCLKIP